MTANLGMLLSSPDVQRKRAPPVCMQKQQKTKKTTKIGYLIAKSNTIFLNLEIYKVNTVMSGIACQFR